MTSVFSMSSQIFDTSINMPKGMFSQANLSLSHRVTATTYNIFDISTEVTKPTAGYHNILASVADHHGSHQYSPIASHLIVD